MPPAASMSWTRAQAAWARSLVSDSTYQEPPAGSSTRPRLDSSAATSCVLRAMRRESLFGRPWAVSNGSVVIDSAPPTAAPKVAIVPRSRFTHGSSRVIMRYEVTACWVAPRASTGTSSTSPTRAQRRRSARSREMTRNWSAFAVTRNSMAAKASAALTPAATSVRAYSMPVATAKASWPMSPAPASSYTRASTTIGATFVRPAVFAT